MITRRHFIVAATAAVGGVVAQQGCSSRTNVEDYEEVARGTWRHGAPDVSDSSALARELVRYATLAPSSHNTQCWKFRFDGPAIAILPDLARRCPAVDPDDHHLFVSLGCATENLIQAARAFGLNGTPVFDDAAEGAISVALEPTKPVVSPLFQAIPERQSTRAEYDGHHLSTEELRLLESAGVGNGVRLILFTENSEMEKVLEYVVQANSAQLSDRAFMAELQAWIRFNGAEAVRTRDGLYAATSGSPSVPTWLGRLLFTSLFTAKGENDKYSKQVRSSAGIAVFVADVEDRPHWIEVGRCYERFALQATALGIRNAFLNQPVEVSALRPQFAGFLGISGRRPDLVVRFGRGPTMPKSLRRSVQSVLV